MKTMNRSEEKTYRLQEGVRVRKEVFGLLFYDGRIPQLTFVPSGQWIEPDFFSREISLRAFLEGRLFGLNECQVSWVQEKLSMLLKKLTERDLVCEYMANS